MARTYNVADDQNEIAIPAVFVVNQLGVITWKYIGEGPPDRPPTAEIIAAVQALLE